MGLGHCGIDKPPAAPGPFWAGVSAPRIWGLGFQPLEFAARPNPHIHRFAPSIAACAEAEHEEEAAWLFRSSFQADPTPLPLICMQPALLLGALVVELHAAAPRPNKCLPSSLP